MKVTLAGLDFDIQSDEALTDEDRTVLSRLSGGPLLAGSVEAKFEAAPWAVLLDRLPENVRDEHAPGPARVSVIGERVLVDGRSFAAEIEPAQKTVRLARDNGGEESLAVVLRVALCCRLPLEGGLPIHAAGVAAPSGGIVFFGPSGAGKSTIAGTSPYPVLSDEFVVLANRGSFEIGASGFWGTLEGGRSPRGFAPLHALIELEKGPAFELGRLSSREALLRLMRVVTIPVSAAVWSAALGVLEKLIESVPVYRMTWTPEQPPWEELNAALAPTPARSLSAEPSGG